MPHSKAIFGLITKLDLCTLFSHFTVKTHGLLALVDSRLAVMESQLATECGEGA